MSPAAVIFDCDGTLVDSEPLSRRAWRRAVLPYGYEVTDADLEACLGRTYAHTHAHFAARAPLPAPERFWPRLRGELFPLLEAELSPFADAVGALDELAARGVPVAVASSSSRERLDRTLRRLTLPRQLAVTVAGDEIERGKPHPDMFLAAARALGAAPGGCVVVEDSPAGVRAGRRAGMRVVAVAREPGAVAGLADADLVVTELTVGALLAAPDPGCGDGRP